MTALSRILCVATLAFMAGQVHAQTVKSQYSVDSVIKSMTSASADSTSAPPTSDCPAGRTPDGDCPSAKVTSVQGFNIAGMGGTTTTKSQPVNTMTNAPAKTKAVAAHKATAPTPAYASNPTPAAASTQAPAADTPKFDMLISFEKNSYTLTPQAQANAQTFAQALNSDQLKTKHLLISGHTDKKGSRSLNVALSEKRAEAVKGYLVSQGVDASRLDAHGYGFDRPLPAHAATDPNNRRVEASLLN